MRRSVLCLATVIVLGGCQMTLGDTAVAAYVPQANAENIQLLEQGVSEMLQGYPVTLANSAFATDNTLLIERDPARDERGGLLEGARRDDALAFTLWLDDGICWLKRNDTGQSLALTELNCQAL
ncbi:hypothetical protein [Aestuariibacter salexigens]|uniref:hypothetical protein n=1 Tax=Aestuariibacter salexigens TaxID=226010 RepID=UPI0005523F3C|nr:hypothetical protein [Aestuariibacter salexigens]